MQKAIKGFAVVAMLAVPGAGAAQSLGEVCEAVTTFGTGQWVEYGISGQTMGMTSMRYGNIGTEERDGQTHTRYELKLSGAQSMTGQILIAGNGGPWDQENVVEMVLQMPGQPAMTLSGDMLAMARQSNPTPDIVEQCVGAEILGHESITVPAGSWDAVHLRTPDGTEVWASLDVPLGVIKVIPSTGPTMELKAHGSGS